MFALLSACMVGEGDSPSESDEPVSLGATLPDAFACFRPESATTANKGYSCSGSPNLIFSTLCQEGATHSYEVTTVPTATEMTMGVIAPHGGKIELGTGRIAVALATELGLPYYVLDAHATSACLDKYGGPTRSNRALHITSVHFNDARAESIMRSVNRGIAIHGHGRANKICVGGSTPALRKEFKRYYDTYTAQYSASGTIAVDAPGDSDCSGITGTASANISNRTGGALGLQLEMSPEFRDELVESLDGDRVQWNSFRKAVRAVCRLDVNGVRGCL